MTSDLPTPSCLFRILATLAFLILAPLTALASDPLQLSGTVSDPTGAVVPGASVSIQTAVNGERQTTQTDDKGAFVFSLPPGKYQLDITAAGFGAYQQDGISVDATIPLRLDVVLRVEGNQESVEVNASGTQIDLSSTQIGEGMGQEKLVAVPLNGRSFTDLLGLQAGVIPRSSKQSNAVVMSGCTTTPPSGDLNPGDVSVSGQRETANGFAVNGSSVEEDFSNIASVVPNLDSIAEFRVLTSNFDAEYGNFSGGQVLVVTKTGSNDLHGSAFEFFRNTNFDATNYLGRERAAYDRNQFGGTLGGHILHDRFLFRRLSGHENDAGAGDRANRGAIAGESHGGFSDLAAQLTGKVSGDYLASLLSRALDARSPPVSPTTRRRARSANATTAFFPED